MEIIKTDTYKCEYCAEINTDQTSMRLHEDSCYKNPKNVRPCHHCKHVINGIVTVSSWFPSSTKMAYCSRKSMLLTDPTSNANTNAYKIISTVGKPMPTTCDLYEKDQTPF